MLIASYIYQLLVWSTMFCCKKV